MLCCICLEEFFLFQSAESEQIQDCNVLKIWIFRFLTCAVDKCGFRKQSVVQWEPYWGSKTNSRGRVQTFIYFSLQYLGVGVGEWCGMTDLCLGHLCGTRAGSRVKEIAHSFSEATGLWLQVLKLRWLLGGPLWEICVTTVCFFQSPFYSLADKFILFMYCISITLFSYTEGDPRRFETNQETKKKSCTCMALTFIQYFTGTHTHT